MSLGYWKYILLNRKQCTFTFIQLDIRKDRLCNQITELEEIQHQRLSV